MLNVLRSFFSSWGDNESVISITFGSLNPLAQATWDCSFMLGDAWFTSRCVDQEGCDTQLMCLMVYYWAARFFQHATESFSALKITFLLTEWASSSQVHMYTVMSYYKSVDYLPWGLFNYFLKLILIITADYTSVSNVIDICKCIPRNILYNMLFAVEG